MQLTNPHPKVEPIAVTQSVAAKMLSVTPKTIRVWELAGILKGTRIGKIKLFMVDELKAVASGGRHGIPHQAR